MRLDRQKGFVFLESLLVLGIAVVLFSLPMFLTKGTANEMDIKLFKTSLTNSITSAQNYAILTDNRTKIELLPKSRKITFKVVATTQQKYNHELVLPEGVEILNTRVFVYYFNSGNGNINQFDPIIFSVNGKRQKVVFQLGSGKFEWQ
ncbi:competence type IV pilus minor pilin ComGD [Pisciglobus halotolerans]|uniref:Competence protein ComGD n=1 Tax=Pisciglobus halotolerans TaxID=745365 RepID=A0A1I3CW02_9LACT|nr:competence type IV pilus minor pilin ComGD [Pisciglobus halotolerans]SFH78627.1 competence protein ComGD [Pisciglobus halotolerans]